MFIIRPGVAGAVLQKPLLLIYSMIHGLGHNLWKYLQNSIYPKPLEPGG